MRKTLEMHKHAVHALAISPDGKLLASGGNDKIINLWGLPDGEFKTCVGNLKTTPTSATTPASPSSSGSSGGSYSYCTCNKVCTCIPLRCQAHRVLHEDPMIRTMAEELLLLMGTQEFEYMN